MWSFWIIPIPDTVQSRTLPRRKLMHILSLQMRVTYISTFETEVNIVGDQHDKYEYTVYGGFLWVHTFSISRIKDNSLLQRRISSYTVENR